MQKTVYTRKDIVRRASYKINMSIDELKIIHDCFIDIMTNMLKESKERIHIEIRNFGTFDILPTNQRKNARNPKTKKMVIIPARKKVVFKPSKNIKKEIYKSRPFE